MGGKNLNFIVFSTHHVIELTLLIIIIALLLQKYTHIYVQTCTLTFTLGTLFYCRRYELINEMLLILHFVIISAVEHKNE